MKGLLSTGPTPSSFSQTSTEEVLSMIRNQNWSFFRQKYWAIFKFVGSSIYSPQTKTKLQVQQLRSGNVKNLIYQ